MDYTVSVEIDASVEQAWAVLVDVERYPEWTTSMTSVRRLDSGAFGLGSKARIKQPRLPTVVWRVTEFEQGRLFSWSAGSAAGLAAVGRHELIESGDRAVTARLSIQQTGLLAPVVGTLLSGLTRRYVEQEAHGLMRRCESGPAGAPP